MDLYDLQVGDRVRLADGTIAEVISETEDGRSIHVRHIATIRRAPAAKSFAPKTRSKSAWMFIRRHLRRDRNIDGTLEGLHAEWRAARDELRALEQRLGVLLQEMNDKEVPAPDVRLTPEHIEELQRLVEEERRLGRRLPDRSNRCSRVVPALVAARSFLSSVFPAARSGDQAAQEGGCVAL